MKQIRHDPKTEKTITAYLTDLPDYCRAFLESVGTKRSSATRFAYIFDLKQFLQYIVSSDLSAAKDLRQPADIKQVPLRLFSLLTAEDLTHFLDSLTVFRNGASEPVSPSYRQRKISSLQAFYRYLNGTFITENDPTALLSRPEIRNTPVPSLSEDQTGLLLTGIRSNDSFLVRYTDDQGEENRYLEEIDPLVRNKREVSLSRNLCIITLFLHAGLKVSELAALNTDDIDYDRQCIRCRKADGTVFSVPLDNDMKKSLAVYLNGEKVSEKIIKRQTDPSYETLFLYCKKHCMERNFSQKAAARFKRTDTQFLTDAEEIARCIRMSGRSAFHPYPYDTSLFLSGHGKRITVRRIEQIVRELSQTYLPASSRDRKISPNALRETLITDIIKKAPSFEELQKTMHYSEKYAKKKYQSISSSTGQ